MPDTQAAYPALRLSKKSFGLFRQFLQSAARIIGSPLTNQFHTCSLRSVFVHVHAAAENDLYFICRFRGELCEAFLTVCMPDTQSAYPAYFLSYKGIKIAAAIKEGNQ